MLPDQSPFDYYLNLQAAVLQGERDYPNAIGDPDLLARRVFLQGVPQWMREALATRDDAPTDILVHCAQQLWNNRVGVSHPQPRPQSTGHRRQVATVAFNPHVASVYENHPMARRSPPRSPPRGARQDEDESNYCPYHRTTSHSLADCRARAREERRCFRCSRRGHFTSSCPEGRADRPFQQRQGSYRGSSSTGITADTRAYYPTSSSRPPTCAFSNAATQVLRRGLALLLNTWHDFTSLSSTVATVCCKESPEHRMEVTEEVDLPLQFSDAVGITHRASGLNTRFPGHILLGMDFLRRFPFSFHHEPPPRSSYLRILGCELDVTFTKHCSLALANLSADPRSTITSPHGCPLHCTKQTEVPPDSATFVKCRVPRSVTDDEIEVTPSSRQLIIPASVTTVEERRTDVWVVNTTPRMIKLRPGQVIARASPIATVYASDSRPLGGRGAPVSSRATPNTVQKVTLENLANEPEFLGDLEDDDFESEFGTLDFGYDDFIAFPDTFLSDSSTSEDEDIGDSKVRVDEVLPVEDAKFSHLTEQQQGQFRELLSGYADIFTEEKSAIGTIPGVEHTIETGDAKPIVTRQWRLPHAAKQTIKEECRKMKEAGVIEPSSSPWLSPVVLVKKKDGTLRFCIDYRNLNKVTTTDSYPLPRIDELIDNFNGTSWFTSLDARSAYWAIPVAKPDRPKTAFSDGHRLWQFARLPFGLVTAPPTFQRAINFILSPVLGKHTVAYLDDIVVHSATFEEHLVHLEETLQLLKAAGLKLNNRNVNLQLTP
ncbi:uncharacterized protein LOC119570135 [Penaeus monodon]|uniref:uncharacterized protein LOC119570135 n=1 Tax=Penaeus monodon TaxID=6687 RepID=UPI0018A7DBED|nr:uncharacterized protein LOC119570135 [Penaeus monodon]